MDGYQATLEAKTHLRDVMVNDWLHNQVFTLRWWLLWLTVLIGYAIFIFLVDKKRTSKILLFGCLMAVASLVYELCGSEFVFWSYKVRTVPTIPSLFIESLTIIPLTFMLMFQYGHTWGKFLILSAVASVVICLGFKQILIAAQILYMNNGWKTIYDIPAYFFSAVIARALTLWWVNSEQKHKREEVS